jgi:signal transduction histidine kinase/DNA-binding response OmpR family regulator
MNSVPLSSGDQTELRFLVDKNADGIIVVDEFGTILFANPATEALFGRTPDSLVGSPVGVPLFKGETTEITIHKPGGKQIEAEIRVVETKWGGKPALLASIRDISARKILEEQLRHTSKMEAIGRLTAGIAHDFNNLLTVVLGNLEYARRRMAESSPLLKPLENAARGARRAATLTERLLAFARRKPLEPKIVDSNALVLRMSELLERTLGETTTVRTILAEDLWTVEVDPTELETAILNLAVNARDAMPDGGEVIIETSNVELDESYASEKMEVTAGSYVEIAVTDTGTGMSPEVLRQVFEPFFTTKRDGSGTGLGLSQVYGFTKQSGGDVQLHSEPGRGTTAKIYLPRARESVPTQLKTKSTESFPLARAGETLLVVEDDHDVRNYTVNSLRELGYTLFDAADGLSALEILKQNPSIQLLLTDLGLPGGMDGKALASHARQLRSDLKVLITTAYAWNALVQDGRLEHGVELLTKPFSTSALACHVREILDREQKPVSPAGKILVVDDEALLRTFVVDVLASTGCQLEEAQNFNQALTRVRMLSAELVGAVIDIGLPDRPGDQLVPEIRKIRPDLPILLATGFGQDAFQRKFFSDRKLRILEKPFSPEQLIGELRKLGAC